MRILIVEDDVELRESLQHQLKNQGFAIDVADNGVDAEFMGDEEPRYAQATLRYERACLNNHLHPL